MGFSFLLVIVGILVLMSGSFKLIFGISLVGKQARLFGILAIVYGLISMLVAFNVSQSFIQTVQSGNELNATGISQLIILNYPLAVFVFSILAFIGCRFLIRPSVSQEQFNENSKTTSKKVTATVFVAMVLTWCFVFYAATGYWPGQSSALQSDYKNCNKQFSACESQCAAEDTAKSALYNLCLDNCRTAQDNCTTESISKLESQAEQHPKTWLEEGRTGEFFSLVVLGLIVGFILVIRMIRHGRALF